MTWSSHNWSYKEGSIILEGYDKFGRIFWDNTIISFSFKTKFLKNPFYKYTENKKRKIKLSNFINQTIKLNIKIRINSYI